MQIHYLTQSQLDSMVALVETCCHFMLQIESGAGNAKLAYTMNCIKRDLERCASEGISTVEYKARREAEAQEDRSECDDVLLEQGRLEVGSESDNKVECESEGDRGC